MSTKLCCVCAVEKARHVPLNGKRSRLLNCPGNLELLINEPLDCNIVNNSVICEKCVSFLSAFSSYRVKFVNYVKTFIPTVIPTVTNYKRSAKTPPSALRRQCRASTIADDIVKSVEKLKHLKISNARSNTRKQINFDHGYVKHLDQPEEEEPDESDTLDPSLVLYADKSVNYYNLLEELDQQLTDLSVHGNSVLFTYKDVDSLTSKHVFNAAVHAMREKCPILLHILSNSFSSSACSLGLGSETLIASIATVYAMILHSRNNKASAIQRIYSSLAIRYHADNELMARLNKIHLTLSAESKRNIIKQFGENLEEKLMKDLVVGKTGKLNGDNLDIRVNTNDVRMQNKDKDYHFFASSYIVDRVDTSSFSSVIPGPNTDISINQFFPGPEERRQYRDSLKVLLSRVLVDHLPEFSWMSTVFPTHIDHLVCTEMATKSKIHVLPISLNNEVSYEGCIHIMDEYVAVINKLYAKAGRGNELEHLKLPVGGDQLTRVGLQGAKSLRAGAHTQQERLDQLYPIVVELFHTQQDFLDKACKKFLKLGKGRDTGTLAHLKAVIQRLNVNGQVKARLKAHEDFTKLVGCAYFLDFVMGKFGMEDQKDEPCHPTIPENINRVHAGKKSLVASTVMDFILDAILIECDMRDTTDPADKEAMMKVSIGNSNTEVVSSVIAGQVHLDLLVNGNRTRITIPEKSLNQGCKVSVPNMSSPLFVQRITQIKPPQDEMENYATNFLQWYFIMVQMTDAIHEGDVIRTNIIMKHMIPFFYSHSVLSKYLVECIDYIMKTEVVLSPEFSMRVRAGSFVNCHGGKGKNKATDMQKENEVKALMELIKGLGANKTEQLIIAISKATPTILDVVSNFDTMIKVKNITTTHKKRSSEEDLAVILKVLKRADVWKNANRTLMGFKAISKSPFDFNKPLFKLTVKRIIDRLQRDLPPIPDDDDHEDSEED